MDFNFDEPNVKAGYCPDCNSHADIYCTRDGVFHCTLCNWMGPRPTYEITKAAKDRHEYNARENWQVS